MRSLISVVQLSCRDLIDPHLHPVMAAVLLPMHFVSRRSSGTCPGKQFRLVLTGESYRQKIAELESAMVGDEPFFTWGYHASWHGDMSRDASG